MKKLTAFIAVCFCCVLTVAKGQTPQGKISGQILDDKNQPAIAATVTLVNATDSSSVKTTVADIYGKFTLDKVKNGEFKLWVTLVGFQKYRSGVIKVSDAGAVINIPAIKLKTGGTTLKEVAVTAQKAFVEQKIDRTVVNVGASIANAGATALEALQNAPGVTVDQNGKISLKGKDGVMVLIDDRPTYLSGEDLANYLRSVPASMLDQIELMSNPPAKYDASGNAGVINIKIKKSKERGFNGSAAAAVGYAAHWRTNESLNLNYHEGKFNFFGNLSYNLLNNYRRLDVGRDYFTPAGAPTSTYRELAFFHPLNNSGNLKLGADYYLSPKTTIGVVYTAFKMRGNIYNPTTSTIRSASGALDSTITAQNRTHNDFNNSSVNLNYSHQYDTLGRNITFDLDYINYVNNRIQSYDNQSYNQTGTLAAIQNIAEDQPVYLKITSAKTDYVQPLSAKAKLSGGLKTSFVNADNAVNYFNIVNNISSIDNNNTNHFLYQENINAGYLNFSQDLKRFSIQAGLRVENTNVHGHQLGNAQSPDSAFTQHYTSLFPTAYLLYKLDPKGDNSLNLNYGRRIDRPNYQSLNPFVVLLDKYSTFTGNPFLRPQFTADYQFTYSFKSMFSLTFEYSNTSDYQVENDYQKGNIFVATINNLGSRIHKSVGANFNADPTKWWNFHLYTEYNLNRFQGALTSSAVNFSSTYFFLNCNNQFTFTHGWAAELGGFYWSPYADAQFTHIAQSQINAGIQKKVIHKQGVIKLGIRDIFNKNISGGNITGIPNTAATYHNDFANRVTTLGFSYNFGTAAKNQRKHDHTSADTERSRAGG